MHVVLCIKQVPDTSDIRIDPKTNTLIREGVPSIVNPSDVNAAEEALRIKDRFGGYVTVLTMGPAQATAALREILAMGADQAILLTDRAFAGADTLATTYTLSMAIKKIAESRFVDLVLFGKRAVDGETGQVGPGVATRMGIPIITSVAKIESINPDSRVVEVRRRLEDGMESIRAKIPVALSITEEANTPRRASLDGLLTAYRSEVILWNKESIDADPKKIGLAGSPTMVKRTWVPISSKKAEVFNGLEDPNAAAEWFLDRLLSVRMLNGSGNLPVKGEGSVVQLNAGGNGQLSKPVTSGSHGDVWVYVEHGCGVPKDVSWELMSEGRRLADKLSSKLAAVVLGWKVANLVSESIAYGAEKVYAVDDPVLEYYRTQPYSTSIAYLSRKYRPENIIIGATENGRDLAGATATLLETGLCADCTGLDVDEQGYFLQTRPTFGGNLMATIVTPQRRPAMASVRPGVMKRAERDPSRRGEVVYEKVDFKPEVFGTEGLGFAESAKTGVRLQGAEVIVAGGKGLGSAKNFYLIEELAKALGGEVGASRGAVNAGWIAHERQVGQTGATVRPRLYLAVGICGAIQHLVGMQNSDHIAAINKDPNAPIFKIADFGVVGDLLQVVPILLDLLRSKVAAGQ